MFTLGRELNIQKSIRFSVVFLDMPWDYMGFPFHMQVVEQLSEAGEGEEVVDGGVAGR